VRLLTEPAPDFFPVHRKVDRSGDAQSINPASNGPATQELAAGIEDIRRSRAVSSVLMLHFGSVPSGSRLRPLHARSREWERW
jgi:hypothetical protein